MTYRLPKINKKHNLRKFDDIKGVIRIRKSKDRQCNGQKEKKDKRINNNLQNITQKTKDRAKQTPPKTCGDLRFSRREAVPAPRVAPVVLFSIYMIHNMKKKLI